MRALALIAIAAASLLIAPPTAEPGSGPRLRIVSERPLVVTGVRFHPYERVRLLISSAVPATRTVRAGQLGRFRLSLHTSVPRCGGLVIQAVGNRGSRAMIDRAGLDCAPPGP